MGRAVAQAVSPRLSLTAEARRQSQISPVGIFGGQRVTGIRISVRIVVYLYHCHSINDLHSFSFSKLLFYQKKKTRKKKKTRP